MLLRNISKSNIPKFLKENFKRIYRVGIKVRNFPILLYFLSSSKQAVGIFLLLRDVIYTTINFKTPKDIVVSFFVGVYLCLGFLDISKLSFNLAFAKRHILEFHVLSVILYLANKYMEEQDLGYDLTIH